MTTSDPELLCHCGRPVVFGYDGDPEHHRGMCRECDLVRCDAYPDECPYRESPTSAEWLHAEIDRARRRSAKLPKYARPRVRKTTLGSWLKHRGTP